MKIPVLDMEGKKIDEMELSPEIFETEINEPVLHQAVRSYLAAGRQGSADTKTRSEVRGGGVKPWRQKGTGRARAGSIRSPLWRGGGTVFGPTPRKYDLKMPKKVRRLALKSALSAKAKASEVVVVDDFNFEELRTRHASEVLKKLKVGKKVVIVIDGGDEKTKKSFQNLAGVKLLQVSQINPYDVLNNDNLIFNRGALQRLTETLT